MEVKIFKNTSYSLLGKMFGMLAIMLLDIFLARRLDISTYAEWVYYFSIVTILFFVGWFGINASAKVIVSRCLNGIDREKCIQTALVLRFVFSLIIGIVISCIMLMLCNKLGYPEKYPDLRKLFLCSGAMIFLNSFTEFFKEIFMGLEEFKMLFVITIVEYSGYLFFSLFFFSFSDSVVLVALSYICSGAIILFLGTLYMKKKYVGLDGYNISLKNNLFAREIVKYAIPLMLVGIGVVILIEIDTFMLGVFGNKHDVAVYSIAKSIDSKAAHVNYSIAVGAMTPLAVIEKKQYLKKRELFKKTGLVNIIATLAISFTMVAIAPLLIGLLYGDDYLEAGAVARMLVPYYILYALSTYYSTFLDFRGKANIRSLAYTSIIVIDILLNLWLIPYYGAFGAALATSISLMPYTVTVIIMTNIEWMRISKDKEIRHEQ